MAYFGGPDVTTNQENTVTGTIDKFVLQHGEVNTWSVALESGDITSGSATGTANGGGLAGMFSATFHGSSSEDFDHDMNPDTANIKRQPVAVVGEFNANFSNGTAAGGFGANIKK